MLVLLLYHSPFQTAKSILKPFLSSATLHVVRVEISMYITTEIGTIDLKVASRQS